MLPTTCLSSRGPAIALDAVSKRVGSTTIVHDLTFSVDRGEIVGVLGPNGAGKTTTLRMCAGFTTASSGRVRVVGFDMATQHDAAARHLGYLPEHPPLYDPLTVTQYLRFVAASKRVPRHAAAAELARVAAACRLDDVRDRAIAKLSKGYRQRVGLAQALLGTPEVLLLDEPTAGLDPEQLHETREVIRAFGAQHAVLLSTHSLPEVTRLCHRVAIIHQGRLLAIDSPSTLQQAAEQTSRVVLTARAPREALQAALRSLAGVIAVTTRPVAGSEGRLTAECQTAARDGVEAAIARAVTERWELYRLERQPPTLEDIFLRYVGQPSGPESAR